MGWLMDLAAHRHQTPQRRATAHPMTPAVQPQPRPVSAPPGVTTPPTPVGVTPGSSAHLSSIERQMGCVDLGETPLAFGALADAAAVAVHRCEEITHPLTDQRPYPIRCHNLPRGHSGSCEPFPSAYRMAVEFHTAMTKRIADLARLERTERP